MLSSFFCIISKTKILQSFISSQFTTMVSSLFPKDQYAPKSLCFNKFFRGQQMTYNGFFICTLLRKPLKINKYPCTVLDSEDFFISVDEECMQLVWLWSGREDSPNPLKMFLKILKIKLHVFRVRRTKSRVYHHRQNSRNQAGSLWRQSGLYSRGLSNFSNRCIRDYCSAN